MRYVLKISDIWYWTVCNPGLGDRTEAQFFFEDFIDGVEDSEVCLEIEVVYGHFIFSGAAVDAACGYGETERFGLFGAGREQALLGEEGAEGGDADAPPVGDAACECENCGFRGADLISERDKCLDHIPIGSHSHFVSAVTDGDRDCSGFFCLGEEEGGVGDHVVEDFTAHAVIVAIGGFSWAF